MDAPQLRHASCVAFGRRGVFISGPSGSGKSSLALQLMGLGAALVADDQLSLARRADGALIGSAPAGLPHLIEARGYGLLRAALLDWAEIVLHVDLGAGVEARLPPKRHSLILDVPVEVVPGPLTHHLPFVIRQYMVAGRGE